MPTRQLPSRPNHDQLKRQARELLNEQRAGTLQACQRIREFHPRYAARSDTSIRAATFALSDSLLTIAREYGFPSWARLRTFVRGEDASSLELPQHERITDRRFRQAVDLLDDGDVDGLCRLLADAPGLATQHVNFEGGSYFREPSLAAYLRAATRPSWASFPAMTTSDAATVSVLSFFRWRSKHGGDHDSSVNCPVSFKDTCFHT